MDPDTMQATVELLKDVKFWLILVFVATILT